MHSGQPYVWSFVPRDVTVWEMPVSHPLLKHTLPPKSKLRGLQEPEGSVCIYALMCTRECVHFRVNNPYGFPTHGPKFSAPFRQEDVLFGLVSASFLWCLKAQTPQECSPVTGAPKKSINHHSDSGLQNGVTAMCLLVAVSPNSSDCRH